MSDALTPSQRWRLELMTDGKAHRRPQLNPKIWDEAMRKLEQRGFVVSYFSGGYIITQAGRRAIYEST